MISLTTLWWNWRHRKLIEETKRIICIRAFLDECGLGKYHFSAKDLLRVADSLKRG